MERTGRVRVRQGMFGKLILQVELKPSPDSDTPKHFRHWRDATVEDISEWPNLDPCTERA